jgi:dUTP pyrophosphatase
MELYILPDTKEVNRDNKLLTDKYTKQSLEHNNDVWHHYDYKGYGDSGFDLFIPPPPLDKNAEFDKKGEIIWEKTWQGKWLVMPNKTAKIGLGIKIIRTNNKYYMPEQLQEDDNSPRSYPYYIYPRSSINKTKLRLANSVGIIDAGYRGELMIALDNISNEPVEIEPFSRLVQVCMPDLNPFGVKIVNKDFDKTKRGEGGFGSTGK